MDLSILLLMVLGLVIYFWIEQHDANLDRHPPVVVSARYPIVYNAVVKAIKTFSYEDYSWFIAYCDPEQGFIQAKCRFREQVTSHLRAERRAIDLDIYLAETEMGLTQLSYSFCVTSRYGRVEAAQIIQMMEYGLQHELNLAVLNSFEKTG
jgi:hypothetical protein